MILNYKEFLYEYVESNIIDGDKLIKLYLSGKKNDIVQSFLNDIISILNIIKMNIKKDNLQSKKIKMEIIKNYPDIFHLDNKDLYLFNGLPIGGKLYKIKFNDIILQRIICDIKRGELS